MNRADIALKTRAVAAELLRDKGFISPVEVLTGIGWLAKADHERWRFRQVPFLEKVLRGNLSQHEFFLRELRAWARDRNLKPSVTVYVSWGKSPRQPLRFTRFGNLRLEDLFATHYVSKELIRDKKEPKDVPLAKQSSSGNG